MYDAEPLRIDDRTKYDANRLLVKKLSFNSGFVNVSSNGLILMISTRRRSPARLARRRLRYWGVAPHPIELKKKKKKYVYLVDALSRDKSNDDSHFRYLLFSSILTNRFSIDKIVWKFTQDSAKMYFRRTYHV